MNYVIGFSRSPDTRIYDALGGHATVSTGARLTLKLPKVASGGLLAHMFVTAGNAWQHGTAASDIVKTSRVSCGVGLVMPLTIGRVRILQQQYHIID